MGKMDGWMQVFFIKTQNMFYQNVKRICKVSNIFLLKILKNTFLGLYSPLVIFGTLEGHPSFFVVVDYKYPLFMYCRHLMNAYLMEMRNAILYIYGCKYHFSVGKLLNAGKYNSALLRRPNLQNQIHPSAIPLIFKGEGVEWGWVSKSFKGQRCSFQKYSGKTGKLNF